MRRLVTSTTQVRRQSRAGAAAPPLCRHADGGKPSPSLAAATLWAGPERLWRDVGYLGQAFESLVVRDLRAHAEANDAAVWHFRDSNGHDLDAVVEHGDGRWLAVEVKLGSGARLDDAARSLTRACEQIDASRVGEPVKKLVITAAGYGYERPDGVSVLPVTALGP